MSKDLFHELREIEILAQMSEEVYMDIPSHLRDQMEIKRIDQPNFRPIYEKDAKWKERHQSVIEASKSRAEREDEIRAMHK
jgi:hypothetical protein